MSLDTSLSTLVGTSARRPRLIALLALLTALLAAFLAATRLGITTSIDSLFDASQPWKQSEAAMRRDYPQFNDLIVAVITARIPEEAEATAADLTRALAADTTHFVGLRRPDASPYLAQEGLLFLDQPSLTDLLDKTVDAAPFLGQLAADPTARGLFGALGLIGEGVVRGQADLGPFAPALAAFDATLASSLHHPTDAHPLSWQSLLAGKLAALAGPDRIVLIQPHLNYRAIQPGGAATQAVRDAAARLEFVANGEAQIHLTGAVPLEDEEFSSAAQGAATGLAVSFVLVLVWLFLALRSWRLILPVVLTLLLGLLLTTGFAAASVGTLNLISVAFAILFVGIAVDFAIQFTVRFREMRLTTPDIPAALAITGARVGRQVLVAGTATAAGFLAFVPTSFRGVAELGLIAGIGMLIALACTLTVLPAALTLRRPAVETAEIGILALAPIDRALASWRRPIVAAFALLFLAGAAATARLTFDSNTMHTKSQTSEAMRTLLQLLKNPLTNPFTVDIVRPDEPQAATLMKPLAALSLTDHVIGLQSFVSANQPEKLALIQDASGILAPVLSAAGGHDPADAPALRRAIETCLAKLRPALPHLPAAHPLAHIAIDLAALSQAPDATLLAANQALIRFLPPMLDRLRLALTAKPATLTDIPPEIARDYIRPDGGARIQVVPKAVVEDSAELRRFVGQVRAIAPEAGGAAVSIVSTADTIIAAFRQAAISAVVAIGLILLMSLRRRQDAALVLAPLLISAALTVLVVVLAGMSLNYANVIALPLLLGVGVSFNIYYVMNARAGEPPKLASATTRAVIFSALTTGTAFGSLAVSAHPGTASMGTLLLISLACTLATSLIFVPALLAERKKAVLF